MYIDDIKKGSVSPEREPEVLNETAATAWVDGKDCMGESAIVKSDRY